MFNKNDVIKLIKGTNVQRNTEMHQWFLEAAKQGDAKCQTIVGDYFFEGKGGEVDYQKAFAWYEKAADAGYIEAINNLGACFFQGKGVETDYEEAAKLFMKAAKAGHGMAQYNLAGCYEQGKGVAKDTKEALRWYELAADNEGIEAPSVVATACYKVASALEPDRFKHRGAKALLAMGGMVAGMGLSYRKYKQNTTDKFGDKTNIFLKDLNRATDCTKNLVSDEEIAEFFKSDTGIKMKYYLQKAATLGNVKAQKKLKDYQYCENKDVAKTE